jgi:hypothetical protein
MRPKSQASYPEDISRVVLIRYCLHTSCVCLVLRKISGMFRKGPFGASNQVFFHVSKKGELRIRYRKVSKGARKLDLNKRLRSFPNK